MRFLFGIVVVGLVVLVGALAYAMRYDEMVEITPPAASTFDRALLDKGTRMAGMGDCEVCHTRAGGEPYAGGLALPTPFGTIYTTNITPDPETGIGKWSLEAFTRAMREGVDREGEYLYPAFPYNHFTKTTDEDIKAIYAFLMARVKPVKYTAPETALPFPFNIRLSLAGWNFLFLKKGPYQPDPTKDEDWNRGAYLVEGLGHCGSCHSPLNALGGEKGGANKFAGGAAEGWYVPPLNTASLAPTPWTPTALENYLFDGWDKQHGITAGPMTPIIRHLYDQDEDDVRAMAEYIASFQRPIEQAKVDETMAFAKAREWNPDAPTKPTDPALQKGAADFGRLCANCHKLNGQPLPLGLTTTVNMPNPSNVIRIVIEGIKSPPGARERSMPPLVVNDGDLAAMLAFMRAQFTTKPAWTNIDEHIKAARAPAAGH
ncbi:MAG: cytochrome c [Alphaproteobacteria bacterium]|nr:cytochrome c [Alphaproteobacteria bacterium]